MEIDLIETTSCRWQNQPRRRGRQSGEIRIYASADQLKKARDEGSLEQVLKVSRLPGLTGPAMAMPDIHLGYGFCIGGVAAFAEDGGIVLPGGVGYDINCGVRMVQTALQQEDLGIDDLQALGQALLQDIPCGLLHGSRHPLNHQEMLDILMNGAPAIARHWTHDEANLSRVERGGCLPFKDPGHISPQALQRGQTQLATLGSGNHFLEIQVVREILDDQRAAVFGLRPGQIMLLLHSGSRGLGHQVASDYIAQFQRQTTQASTEHPDPQLTWAPLHSPPARRYLDAQNGAANFAWANRHLMMHNFIESLQRTLHISPQTLSASLVTDHSHNLATWEDHPAFGRLLVHRKGATRALPPGHPELGIPFQETGQAVVLPGSMGASTYLLCGSRGSDHAWHSCPHGAGRLLSRRAAAALDLQLGAVDRVQARKILLFSHSPKGLAEEIPEAYKPIGEVLSVIQTTGLASPVARMDPLVVVKG